MTGDWSQIGIMERGRNLLIEIRSRSNAEVTEALLPGGFVNEWRCLTAFAMRFGDAELSLRIRHQSICAGVRRVRAK